MFVLEVVFAEERVVVAAGFGGAVVPIVSNLFAVAAGALVGFRFGRTPHDIARRRRGSWLRLGGFAEEIVLRLARSIGIRQGCGGRAVGWREGGLVARQFFCGIGGVRHSACRGLPGRGD